MSADKRPLRLGKKGNRRIARNRRALQTPQERRAGARPSNRPETRSGLARADVLFLQSACFTSVPDSHESGREGASSDPPISRLTAERRRLKKARETPDPARKGASPSLDLTDEENRDGETIQGARSGRTGPPSTPRLRRQPRTRTWSGVTCGPQPRKFCLSHSVRAPARQFLIVPMQSVKTYGKRQIRGARRARTVVLRR